MAVSLAVFVLSCTKPILLPARSSGSVEGKVDVSCHAVDGDVVHLTVHNYTSEYMTVDGNAFVLEKGDIHRRSTAGAQSFFHVAPGGAHDADPQFSLDGLVQGDTVTVKVDDAIAIGGKHLGVPTLTFDVR